MWVAVKWKGIRKPFKNVNLLHSLLMVKIMTEPPHLITTRAMGISNMETKVVVIFEWRKRVEIGMKHMERLLEVVGKFCLFFNLGTHLTKH